MFYYILPATKIILGECQQGKVNLNDNIFNDNTQEQLISII